MSPLAVEGPMGTGISQHSIQEPRASADCAVDLITTTGSAHLQATTDMFDVRRFWGGGDTTTEDVGEAAQVTEEPEPSRPLVTASTSEPKTYAAVVATAPAAKGLTIPVPTEGGDLLAPPSSTREGPSSPCRYDPDDGDGLGRRLDSPPPAPTPTLFSIDFPRPSDLYEREKRLPPLFEEEGMTEVVRGARKVRVPKPKPNKRPSVVGPPVPDIRKAIDLAGKTPATVASEMGVAVEELEDAINRRDTAVSRWAPVLAKCTRMAKVGLLRLVSRECPCGCTSAGHHIFLTLKRAGDQTITKCREHLIQGWEGWTNPEYRLTDALIDKFFAGQSKEAEKVADFLFRLANATDRTNIFCIFVE